MPIKHTGQGRLTKFVRPAQHASVSDLAFGIKNQLQHDVAYGVDATRSAHRRAM